MAKKKKNTHGGAREGAGRKPGPGGTKRPISIKLEPLLLTYLHEQESIIGTIESAIKRTKAFKDWKEELASET